MCFIYDANKNVLLMSKHQRSKIVSQLYISSRIRRHDICSFYDVEKKTILHNFNHLWSL